MVAAPARRNGRGVEGARARAYAGRALSLWRRAALDSSGDTLPADRADVLVSDLEGRGLPIGIRAAVFYLEKYAAARAAGNWADARVAALDLAHEAVALEQEARQLETVTGWTRDYRRAKR